MKPRTRVCACHGTGPSVDQWTPPTPPNQTHTDTDDLKTTACCAATVPKRLRRLLRDVHEDVLAKFYGCGSPLPEGLEGCTVLDLGCGSGRDCFVGAFVCVVLAEGMVGPP